MDVSSSANFDFPQPLLHSHLEFKLILCFPWWTKQLSRHGNSISTCSIVVISLSMVGYFPKFTQSKKPIGMTIGGVCFRVISRCCVSQNIYSIGLKWCPKPQLCGRFLLLEDPLAYGKDICKHSDLTLKGNVITQWLVDRISHILYAFPQRQTLRQVLCCQ